MIVKTRKPGRLGLGAPAGLRTSLTSEDTLVLYDVTAHKCKSTNGGLRLCK